MASEEMRLELNRLDEVVSDLEFCATWIDHLPLEHTQDRINACDVGAKTIAALDEALGLAEYSRAEWEAKSLEQSIKIARLTKEVGELREAVRAYCTRYLLDEHEDPDLCGIDAEQHRLLSAMFEAAALSGEEGGK